MTNKIFLAVFLPVIFLLVGAGCQKPTATPVVPEATINQPGLEYKIEPYTDLSTTTTAPAVVKNNKKISVPPKSTVTATTTPATATAKVEIKDFSFESADLEVAPNTTVIWTNLDPVSHTLVSPGNFESPILNTGDTFKYTFSKMGVYIYYCSIHPTMVGKVILK